MARKLSLGVVLALLAVVFTGCDNTGSLVINLAPEAAVTAGAQWRVDGATWQNSGATVPKLAPGEHAVTYQEVPGWTTPLNHNVTITKGQTTKVTGTYTQGGGEGEGEHTAPASAPQNVKAISSATQVLVRWNAVSDVTVTGYNVYRSTSSGGTYTKLTNSPCADTRFPDTGATSGSTYYYRVAAVNSVGEGPRSNAVDAKAGSVKFDLPVMAMSPGNFARIPIGIENATGISPSNIHVVIQYDPAILDGSAMQVERTALTAHAQITIDTSTAGQVAITATDDRETITGSGKLFDLYTRSVWGAGLGASGDLSLLDADIKDSGGAALAPDLSDTGQITLSTTGIRGDSNQDGTVDVEDAERVLGISVGSTAPETTDFAAGDLNGDTILDAADAAMALRMAGGLMMNPTGPDAGALLDVLTEGGAVTLTAGNAQGAPDDTVDVPISISDATGMAGFTLAVSYSSEAGLELQDVLPGGLLGSFTGPVIRKAAGYARISAASANALGSTGSELPGTLLVLRFKLNETARAGFASPIVIGEADLNGQFGDDFAWYVRIARQPGQVAVVSAAEGEGEGPRAAFSVDHEMGLTPLTVQFTDHSVAGSQSIGIRQWDFGDGQMGSVANPTHAYEMPGVYTVRLSVMNPAGSDTAARTIIVDLPLTASFTADNAVGLSGAPPFTVQFTDKSEGYVLGITSWEWDFGDGATSTEQHPSHTYATLGNFAVSLKVSTPITDDTITQTVTSGVAPTAGFTMDVTSGSLPLAVQFTDTSQAGTMPIKSWGWAFGDDVTSNERNPIHSYIERGIYTVTLAIASDLGTNTFVSTVYPGYLAGDEAAFGGTEFVWCPPGTFEMGQVDVAEPVHEVTLTKGFWMSKYECTQAQWAGVMGVNPSNQVGDLNRPVEMVSWSMIAGSGGFIDTLNAATPGVNFRLPTEAEWEYACRAGSETQYYFGDSSAQLYLYSWFINISAHVPHPVGSKLPNAWNLYDMSGNVCEWCQDLNGNYAAGPVTDPTGPAFIYGVQSHVIRGGSCESFADYCRSSTRISDQTTEAFFDLGFRLAASPKVCPLTARFDWDNKVGLSGEAPRTVQFMDTSYPRPITSRVWDFGDGATSTEQNPKHSYATTGDFTVTLTVGNGTEEKDVSTTVTSGLPPTALFRVDVTFGALPLVVQFTDTSDPGTSSIVSWSWDFGDGGTSTDQNPSHTYTDQASITASLTVTTGIGTNTQTVTLTPGYGITETFAGIEFVLLPPGTFQMGYAGANYAQPVHQVTLTRGFWMSKYELTQAQWQAVMGANPSRFTGDARRPVERVSWDMIAGAGGFIEVLNAANPGMGFRLPTEAEWEYACRANSLTEYYFGADAGLLGDYAWYEDNSSYTTHPVGEKTPNYWGLYDMSGNVWEWVQDWYGSYTADAATDPVGPNTGNYRVQRGGSWESAYAEYCSSAYRGQDYPSSWTNGSGFRLARF